MSEFDGNPDGDPNARIQGGAKGDRIRFATDLKRLLTSPEGKRFVGFVKDRNGRRAMGMTFNTQEKMAELHRLQGETKFLDKAEHLLDSFITLDTEGE